jgi:uncharacterized protein (UPF0297 family)
MEPKNMNEKNEQQGTVTFSTQLSKELGIKFTLFEVYNALKEKGYDPINQIVGYIVTQDPTYITNHKNARSLITKMDRDELLAALIASYIEKN